MAHSARPIPWSEDPSHLTTPSFGGCGTSLHGEVHVRLPRHTRCPSIFACVRVQTIAQRRTAVSPLTTPRFALLTRRPWTASGEHSLEDDRGREGGGAAASEPVRKPGLLRFRREPCSRLQKMMRWESASIFSNIGIGFSLKGASKGVFFASNSNYCHSPIDRKVDEVTKSRDG